MSWDEDTDFEDDFDNSPQGFRDYDDDWGSSHDPWTGDDDTEQPVIVTNPEDFQSDDWGHDDGASGWGQESREDFGDDGGGGGWDDKPYGPPDGPTEYALDLNAEWNGDELDRETALYPPDEWNEDKEAEAERLADEADADLNAMIAANGGDAGDWTVAERLAGLPNEGDPFNQGHSDYSDEFIAEQGGDPSQAEELQELQLDNAEREAQRFDFQDEQGDPEDETDARDEHDGFWGGLWNRFTK